MFLLEEESYEDLPLFSCLSLLVPACSNLPFLFACEKLL